MYRLNNGIEIPPIGFGVFELGDNTEQSVLTALEAGYRLIDAAANYGNEVETGRAIRASGIRRNELFITTKLWNDDMRADRQKEAFEKSLKRLGTDYIDLYLIHWPVEGKYVESWHIMEELYRQKLVRAIGVCNFNREHLETLFQEAEIAPTVNQIEIHPYCAADSIRSFCAQRFIQCEGWSPLGRGMILNNSKLQKIALEHRKSAAQIAIKWQVQHGLIPLPRSSSPQRIRENIDIWDFTLSDAQMQAIDALNQDKHIGATPEHFTF